MPQQSKSLTLPLTQVAGRLLVLASTCLEQALDREAGDYEDMVG